MTDVLLIDQSEAVATLTLNRPESMNALNRELRQALVSAFETLAGSGCPAIIVTGAGRAFCAGMDLKEAATGPGEAAAFSGEADVIGAMAAFPGVIIGAVNGHAITAGFELALNCDILVAATDAKFADTHARVGMLPGWGLSQRLPRLIGINRAKELSLTGNFLTAETAAAWGLVNRLVPPEALLATCRQLADEICTCDRQTLLAYKRLMDTGYAMDLKTALAYESDTAIAWAKRITAGAIARNREQVQERGHQQDTA